MVTTSGLAQQGHRSAAVATVLFEAPEPTIEPLGVDDPGTAHGGRSRRTPGPPIPNGLVTRVRAPVVLPTKVQRLPIGPS